MKEHTIRTEQDIARNLVDLLNDSANNLDAETVAKLNISRQQAVAAHMHLRKVPAYSLSGLSHTFSDYFNEHRTLISSGLAFGGLIAALLLAQAFNQQTKVEHSDAYLLGSELPPEAYADKEFDTWIDAGL